MITPWLLLAALLTGPAAHATQIAVRELPCPLGGRPVKVYVKLSEDTHGGFDSDLVAYSTQGQFREFAVSSCPDSMFSLYGTDMEDPITEDQRARLQATLAPLVAALPNPSEPEVWERYAIAAHLYEALDRDPLFVAEVYLGAAWTARDAAVGVYMGLEGPDQARLLLQAGGPELAKIPDAPTRRKVLYNLARVAIRGGWPAEAEGYLRMMEASGDLSPAETEAVARMRRMSQVVEPRYQDLAVDHLLAGLRREGLGMDEKIRATYLLADTLRRRGRFAEAVPLYLLVSEEPEAPDELRSLSDWLGASILDEARKQAEAGGLIAPKRSPG